MFRTKSTAEQLQDHSASLAGTAATVADQLRGRVAPAVGQAAETAKEWGQPRVEAARDWARPRVEHGIEVAAPKLESAVSALAPKVDTARDKIVDELLPRVAEAITALAAASTAAKAEALSRGQGASAVLSGDAVASGKHKKKKGRVLLILSVLAAAAAAAIAFLKKPAPKDDPWTTPLADPYVPSPTVRHPAAAPDEEPTATAPTELHLTEDLDETDAPDPLHPSQESDLAGKDGAKGGSSA
jgi:hypothetical protein